MSMFGTSGTDGGGLDEKRSVNWLEMGIHKCQITGAKVDTSSKGSKRVMLSLEGEPVQTPGFKKSDESVNGGRTITVAASIYITTDDATRDLMDRLALIAKHTGKKEAIDAVDGSKFADLEDYLNAALPTLIGGNIAYFKLKGSEYVNKKNQVKVNCELARYAFVKGAEFAGEIKYELDESGNPTENIISVAPNGIGDSETTMTFDKTNPYDFEQLAPSTDSPDSGVIKSNDGTAAPKKKLWGNVADTADSTADDTTKPPF